MHIVCQEKYIKIQVLLIAVFTVITNVSRIRERFAFPNARNVYKLIKGYGRSSLFLLLILEIEIYLYIHIYTTKLVQRTRN